MSCRRMGEYRLIRTYRYPDEKAWQFLFYIENPLYEEVKLLLTDAQLKEFQNLLQYIE